MDLSRGRLRRSGWAAWAGLAAGVAGWGLHQQVLADMLHYCTLGGRVVTLVGTAAAVLLIAAGAWLSWLARPPRSHQGERDSSQRFVADLSLLARCCSCCRCWPGPWPG